MATFLLATFFVAMVVASLAIEGLFAVLGLIPDERPANVVGAQVTFNYTTVFNLVFLVLAGVLLVRFVRTGGRQMLAQMR